MAWMAAVGVLAGGGAAWHFTRGVGSPDLPEIALSQLDADSARQLEQWQDAVRRAPRSGAAWGKLGGLLYSLEFHDEASRCFAKAEKLEPTEPRWPYLHGLLLANGAPTEAIPRLRRAVALCGNDPEMPRLRLARLLGESGQWTDAQRELDALIRARPDYAPARLALAHAALARDDVSGALAFANRCTTDRRTARAAWSLLAALHQRLSETNAAQSASRQAASSPPDAPVADPFEAEVRGVRTDARDLSDRAQRLLESGRLTEVAPLVQQLVREHPRFSEGWLLLGRWQVLNNDLEAAGNSLRRHLEMEPESVNGHFQLGRALLARERFDEAAAAFQRATQLKPDSGPAFYNLGFALARSGRTREALAPFREAIRHNPERIDSYVLLADLHVQLGENAKARELLAQAEAINASDPRLATLRRKIGGN
jgi:tetratricopeptide (TPR) repeat protein